METDRILGVMDMARKQAWSFCYTTGMDFEDLCGEAMVAVVKASKSFQPKGGAKFTTWSYQHIRWSLINFTKRSGRTQEAQKRLSMGYTGKHVPSSTMTRLVLEFNDVMDSLSEDVQLVKELLLNSEKYLERPSKGIYYVRKEIRDFLVKKRGWNGSRVDDAYLALKMSLNNTV